jgi:hypothetical protein
MEALLKQRAELFFPREVGAVTSRDQLDQHGKLKFIRERGLAEWERLPQTAQSNTVVVLDQSRLTRAQWLSLDRKTRSALLGQWGAESLTSIMARK